MVLRLFTHPRGRRAFQQEKLSVLTALLFCLADPLSQGVAGAAEVREACHAGASLGLRGQQLVAARRLTSAQVQLHLTEMAESPDTPVRQAIGGFSI